MNLGVNCSKVIEAIRNNGCKVLGVVTIFDYGFAATKRKFEKLDVSLTALTDFETVLRHAATMGIIDEEQQNTIENWQHNPAKWGK